MLNTPAAMVKAETRYRLDQNLSQAERRKKRGHYYVFRWHSHFTPSINAPLIATLEYRQSKTGRSIKKKTVHIHQPQKKSAEIYVIGDDYLKNGRILSWRATLSQNGKTLASEQSFLWE